MGEYAALTYLYLAKKKKCLFFKRYWTKFYAIYYDEKFYKKKKWPGHLGKLWYKFQGKGHFDEVPEYLGFDTDMQEDPTQPIINYSPSKEEATQFVNDIGGDFKILDSAKYADKNYDNTFTVYNVYDEENHRYVVFVIGILKSSKSRHEKNVRFVENDLRKAFHEKSSF